MNSAHITCCATSYIFFLDAQMDLRSFRQSQRLERAKYALIVNSIDIVVHIIILPHRRCRSPANPVQEQCS